MSKLFYRFFVVLLILIASTTIALSQNNKVDNSEDEIGNLPVDVKITGENLKAISIAFETFKNEADIPEIKKQIENYEIYIQQNKDNFFILFLANRTKDEINLRDGSSSLGGDVRYTIDKKNYKIIQRVLFK